MNLTPLGARRLLGVDLHEIAGQVVDLDALARDLGCSRKHLATRFRREVGLTPKAFARVLRFARAVDALRQGRGMPLARLAADCGYAGQAHLSRDVRRFSGDSPRTLARRALADGTGLMAGEREQRPRHPPWHR